jgi:hypothetical protein
MKQYFILLSSGLIVSTGTTPKFVKYPHGSFYRVDGAVVSDAAGKLLRIIEVMFIDALNGSITARWEEPVAEVPEDAVAVMQQVA